MSDIRQKARLALICPIIVFSASGCLSSTKSIAYGPEGDQLEGGLKKNVSDYTSIVQPDGVTTRIRDATIKDGEICGKEELSAAPKCFRVEEIKIVQVDEKKLNPNTTFRYWVFLGSLALLYFVGIGAAGG